ncbi:hypothetical protein V8C35DRAFT_305353 [Trichoderma chlorosporum]
MDEQTAEEVRAAEELDKMVEELRGMAEELGQDQIQQLLKIHKSRSLAPLLTLTKREPWYIMSLVNDGMSEEAVLDYVTDLDVRHLLFERLIRITRQSNLKLKINMTVFAVFMVAPIDGLKSALKTLEENIAEDRQAEIEQFISQCEEICVASVKSFSNKGGRPPGSSVDLESPGSQTPDLMGSPNISRADIAARLCKERDYKRCMLTGMPDPVAAYIFPFAGSKGSKIHIHNLFSTLRTFWGDDTATKISALVHDRNITESPQNLLSLNHQLHWWFDNGRMALKPLGTNKDGSVQVQLHWLRTSTLKPTQIFDDLTTIRQVINSSDIGDNKYWGRIEAHRPSGLPLKTGQTFKLRADDSNEVPNIELLQLSWDLLRVVAICGAAELFDWWDIEIHEGDDGCYEFETQSTMDCDDDFAEISRWREFEEQENEEEEGPSNNDKSSL